MAEQSITKTCSTCKQIKPLPEFHKNRNTKDGYQNYCKSCKADCQKQYRQTERGKITNRKGTLRYSKSAKGKATINHYRQSEQGKLVIGRLSKQYRQSKKGKAYIKNYGQSKEGKESQKRYRKSEKRKNNFRRYCSRHPNRLKARYAVNNAVRDGRLPHPDILQCHYCPAKAQEYHHWHGYEPEHWFDVVPVCKKCHKESPNSHRALPIA